MSRCAAQEPDLEHPGTHLCTKVKICPEIGDSVPEKFVNHPRKNGNVRRCRCTSIMAGTSAMLVIVVTRTQTILVPQICRGASASHCRTLPGTNKLFPWTDLAFLRAHLDALACSGLVQEGHPLVGVIYKIRIWFKTPKIRTGSGFLIQFSSGALWLAGLAGLQASL
jgi:hypothetical protein